MAITDTIPRAPQTVFMLFGLTKGACAVLAEELVKEVPGVWCKLKTSQWDGKDWLLCGAPHHAVKWLQKSLERRKLKAKEKPPEQDACKLPTAVPLGQDPPFWRKEFKLLPYQAEGIAFAAPRAGAFFLWPAGVGKTVGAINWALHDVGRDGKGGGASTLVVAIAPTVVQWARELAKFSTADIFIFGENASVPDVGRAVYTSGQLLMAPPAAADRVKRPVVATPCTAAGLGKRFKAGEQIRVVWKVDKDGMHWRTLVGAEFCHLGSTEPGADGKLPAVAAVRGDGLLPGWILTFDGNDVVTPLPRFCVIGWEMMREYNDMLAGMSGTGITSMIVDECFPAGTPVMTVDGERPIESLKAGDVVLSQNLDTGELEWKPVVNVMRRVSLSHLVKLTAEGRSVECTPNHKIWSEGKHGYQQADGFAAGDEVRVLRRADDGVQGSVLHPKLRGEVASPAAGVQGAYVGGRAEGRGDADPRGDGENRGGGAQAHAVNSQPDARPVGAGQGVGSVARSAVPDGTGWERETVARAAAEAVGVDEVDPRASGRGAGVGSADVGHPDEEVDGGFGRSDGEGRGGSGRQQPQSVEGAAGRRDEESRVGVARLEGVAVQERRSAGGSGKVRVDGVADGGVEVFNVEVADNHNYFAAGILVSNCQKGAARRRRVAVPLDHPDEDGNKVEFKKLRNLTASIRELAGRIPRRLICTATPIMDRPRDLWAQWDICEPWQPGSYKNFAIRYCNARPGAFGGIDDSGTSNMEELRERLSSIIHQVSAKVARAQLPPMRRTVVYLPPEEQSEPGDFRAEYKRAADAGHGADREVRLMEAAAKKRGYITTRVVEVLRGDPEAKILVFTGRRKDCEILGDAVRKALLKAELTEVQVFCAHGGNSQIDRQAAVDAYRLAKSAVLVGTGDSFGTGIDGMQCTDLQLHAMLPVSPGQVMQREGRAIRVGQDRPVLVEYVIAEGTEDERAAELLINKLPAVETVVKSVEIEGMAKELAYGDGGGEGLVESVAALVGGSDFVDDEEDE